MRERSQLGQRIVAACNYAGMSQGHLANAIGITENGLTSIIRGRTKDPCWSTMIDIAQATGVSLNFLAGREGQDAALREAAGRG